MNYPYLFQTQYADHTGIFGAATLEEATILAWSSIEPLLSNPDPKLLTVTPMTQEMIDRFPDKAFLAKLQPYQPWKLYPPRRPVTQIEVEAITGIINLRDELEEAKKVIKLLLRTRDNPEDAAGAREKAREFLKPKPLKIVADGNG